MTKKEYWFWLCNIDNIGLKKIQAVLNIYGSPENAFHESVKGIEKIESFTLADLELFRKSKNPTKIKENYDKLKSKGIYFVTIDDKDYPSKLHNIDNPPFSLYVKGKLPEEKHGTLAIIGARDCSDYGKEMAGYLSRELAKAGLQIISGLARGIDGFAHKGALSVGGNTFAVEGCGVDICYPKENYSVYMELQKEGGVISEYGLGVCPKAGNFPMRNRLISGMSDGILVIEAKEKSGSLITVDMGLDQGKNIYSLPGRIGDLLSIGCNNLIKMGAKLVSGPEDILEDFLLNYTKKETDMKKNDNSLETKEKIVYASLSFLPKHINEIMGETNFSISEITEILINLELKNYIKQIRKNYFSYM